MDETLIIEKLGPIRKLEIKPRPLTLIIGEQASGKSLVAQVLYFFRGLESHVGRAYSLELIERERWHGVAVKQILDNLRGVPFGYFADGTATLRYRLSLSPRSKHLDWKLSVYSVNRLVRPLKSLREQMDRWADSWIEDKEALGRTRRLRQIFIPTERSMITRLSESEESVLYADYQPEPIRRLATILNRAARTYESVYPRLRNGPPGKRNMTERQQARAFILDCQRKALAGEAYVPRRGLKRWKWRIRKERRDKILPIQATASGQMEAWPFFALATVFGAHYLSRNESLDFYFEEPETHLHPAAQVEVMKVIAYLVNRGQRFVVTTHSPFIAYVVDNMMQRFMAYKGQIPEGQVALNPDDVAAYRLRQSPDEPPEDIMDREDTRLLKLDELERVADELEAEFAELLEKAEGSTLTKLLETLQTVFPRECFTAVLSIKGKGRRFSVQSNAPGKAVGIDLDKCEPWPPGKKRCDGLFVCIPPASKSFLIVLVELKGTYREDAFDQLIATTEILCCKSTDQVKPYGSSVIASFQSCRLRGHEKHVLGIVVTKGSLPKRLLEKKQARTHKGLKIKSVTTKILTTTVSELANWFHSRR